MYKVNLLCLNIIKNKSAHSGKSVIPSFLKNANLSITLVQKRLKVSWEGVDSSPG